MPAPDRDEHPYLRHNYLARKDCEPVDYKKAAARVWRALEVCFGSRRS